MKLFSRVIIIFCLGIGAVCLVTAADKNPTPTPVPAAPWTKWEKATTLEGGAGLKTTKIVSAFDHWYSGTTTMGIPKYYTVNVSKDATYEIYWDDKTEGSAKYTNDIIMWVFKMDGNTKYDTKDSGYRTPLTIVAKETSINIVITSLGNGNYAFGIRKK